MRVTRSGSDSPRPKADLLVLIAVSLLAAWFYPLFSLNHDASWYLIATDRFLDGADLYTEIFEINPPLAFYLTVPPVAAARTFGSDPTTAYFLYCVAIGLLSSLWTLHILGKADLPNRDRRALFYAIIVAQFVLPIAEFGQREHLMLLLAMPFFISQIFRSRLPRPGTSEQIALGITASLGLLLKPYFLLIPAAIGLMRLWQERDLKIFVDPAYLALAGATILYLTFIVVAQTAYLALVIPMAIHVYDAYGMDAAGVVSRPELLGLALMAIVIWRSGLVSGKGLQVLVAASIGAAMAYLFQFKGWNYHILPLSAFLLVGAAWVAVSRLETIRRDALVAVSIALLVITTLGVQLVRGPYESPTKTSFEQSVGSEDQSILILSTNVWASFPFVNEVSGKWASRYPAQWLIPGAYNRLAQGDCGSEGVACSELEGVLDFARNSIIEDIEQFQPDLIFVDEREEKSYFRSLDFDYFEFLAADARFEEIRPCYERVGEAIEYGVYSNSCRRPASDRVADSSASE